jgi:sugar-specific transcriptional regulator TrmB
MLFSRNGVFMNDSEINSLLEKLGLTEYEAKTISTLFKLKESEAPDISRQAQVPKTRVYDVLDRLIGKKLVIETNDRPKKYRAVEVENAFLQLLESKKTELADLEAKTTELKEKLLSQQDFAEEEGEKIMKVKDKQDFIKILAQEIGKAKKEVVALTKLDQNYPLLKDSIRLASKRKVDVRLIGHTQSDFPEISKEFEETGIETRSSKHGLNAFVIDGKKVILSISDLDKEKPEYHFTIWPNNTSMATALQNYFEDHWKKSK